MEKTKNQFFDNLETVLKIATPLGAILVFLIGIYHYRDSQAEEFKKVYWEKRFHVYEEISQVSSQIANSSRREELDYLKRHFLILYTGRSIIIEDLHVANAMHSFRESLDRAVYPDSMHLLQSKAHAISQACRTSLKETWEPVPLSEIHTMDH